MRQAEDEPRKARQPNGRANRTSASPGLGRAAVEDLLAARGSLTIDDICEAGGLGPNPTEGQRAGVRSIMTRLVKDGVAVRQGTGTIALPRGKKSASPPEAAPKKPKRNIAGEGDTGGPFEAAGSSKYDKILTYIGTRAPEPVRAIDVIEHFCPKGDTRERNLWQVSLVRFHKQGRLRRVSRGLYTTA